MPDQQDQLAAALADRYRIERQLGAGGMATVYLAHDLKHERQVAIKVLRPELASVLGPERFLREIHIAARLTHPHILALHDSGAAGGLFYYVMPFIDGESLRERLLREGPLPVAAVGRIMREVADALAYAHQHGVVHRDIKADNVMQSGEHALVADFGIAKAAAQDSALSTTATGMAIGTPMYMAPEQAFGDRDVDYRADIYALGVLAWELLAGEPPWTGDAQSVFAAKLADAPPPLSRYRADVPSALEQIIRRCLAVRREDRWAAAADVVAQLDLISTPASLASIQRPRRTRRALLASFGLAAAAIVAFLAWPRHGEAWIRDRVIPQVQRLADNDSVWAAFILARRADERNPGNVQLSQVWPAVARRLSVITDPPGARISWRPYDTTTAGWQDLGVTPLDSVWFPLGQYRFRIDRQGHRPLERVVSVMDFPRSYQLDRPGDIPDDVVRVPEGRVQIRAPGLEAAPRIGIASYLLDSYETTNRQYKEFLEAGGYAKAEYWVEPFLRDGRTVPFAAAVAAFTDRSGRPGPAGWELGDYPDGQDDYPVGGLSWYEAAAYARFRERALPTIYHWHRAAGTALATVMMPASNMAAQGPVAVTANAGLNAAGVYGMAGNVREWCFNADGDRRYLLGGGWSDPPYLFGEAYAVTPWDRAAGNGVRLATYLPGDSTIEAARRPVPRRERDFLQERPVGNAEFELFRRLFSYDHAPLNATVESADTTEHWVRQRVSYDGVSGERGVAYVYLPRSGRPPWQTVLFFPGADALSLRSINTYPALNFDFVMRGGRAVIVPVYRGTFDRGTGLLASDPSPTSAYRDNVIHWVRETGRAIDYLGSRTDMDTSRLAYYGFSWGGRLGPLVTSVDGRFKVAVLAIAGLNFQPALPEVDDINYAGQMRIPTLMLNTRLDYTFPLETSAVPLFRLLGTPAEHKRQVVFEGGHYLPRGARIRETLDWLDRYMGPVAR